MKGQFRIRIPSQYDKQNNRIIPPQFLILPNIVTKEGEDAFLKMVFRNDDTIVAAGANFYFGLCNQTPGDTDTLATITTEPTAGVGGYARLPAIRTAVGWPTISVVNGRTKIETLLMNFAAVGADFDQQVSRLFMCNVLAGTAGILFAYSAPLDAPITILNGADIDVVYEFFAN